MLLRFKIDDQGFRCLDSAIAATAISINYIKCHFDVAGTEWEDVDAICAIFKSATYNQHYEVMLDSNNNCLIDPEIYMRGGAIQVKLVGDKYINDSVISSTSTTSVVEFYIRDGIILPTPVPSKYDVFVAEIEIARQAVENAILDLTRRIANGELKGKDGASISNIISNPNGTLTIELSDGQSYTSSRPIRGEKGEPGEDGVGIASVVYGEDGTLLITMSDGTQYVSPYSMKGEKGDKGDPGEGVAYIAGSGISIVNGVISVTSDIQPVPFVFGDIPDYVKDEAVSVANKVKEVQTSNTVTSIVWADAHHTAGQVTGWQEQTNKSTLHAAMGAAVIAASCPIDFCAYCGDYTFGNGETTVENFKEQCTQMNRYMDVAFGGTPSFYCVGNHDTGEYYLRDNTDGKLYGADLIYSLIGNKNNDGVTVMGSTKYGYCYRDIPSKKIRVINLNTVEGETEVGYSGNTFSDEQLLWFAQALYDVGSESDWGIIVVSHYPLDYGDTSRGGNIVYQYVNGGSVNIDGTTVNFSGHNLAKFVAQYHGHTHCLKVDKLHYIVNQSGTEFDAYRIATPSGTFFRNNDYAGHSVYGIDFGEDRAYTKTADTGKDTAFVVNVYDPDLAVIYSFCYGAGYDRVISVGDKVFHRITQELTHISSDNAATTIENEKKYVATLSIDSGYALKSITITMGGTDITSSAYDSSTGRITINSVTGPVVITAVASRDLVCTNMVPLSTDANGNIYNVTGYKDGSRINSSGAETGGSHMSVTGFIPFTHDQTLRLGGPNILFNEYGCMMYFYDSNKSALDGYDYNKVGNTNFGTWDTTEADTAFSFKPAASKLTSVAYVRISASVRNAGDTGEEMIVTINEPIA